MSSTKSDTLTIRIHPDIKEALRAAAQNDHRSITNMIEVMIRNYCVHHGITTMFHAPTNKDDER